MAFWILSISVSLAQDTTSSEDRSVWHWFVSVAQSETLQVHVSFQGKAIYQKSIPILRMHRSEIEPEQPQKILKFFFKADPKIFDPEFKVYPPQRIEGNIWEAGRDADDILLGVSFVIPRRILLNTIHIAQPLQSARSQLAKGLSIETYPLKSKR
jgi:hypothetical protein